MSKLKRRKIHKSESMPFKPRARMLLLLGDQLIRDPGIAIFELVKNAYDADSPNAIIKMSKIENPVDGKIIIQDTGSGMDFNTVTHVWLEPGTDYRAQQRKLGKRSEKYGRLPLGEKGVGRFAAHKLGKKIRLVTRKVGNSEILVEINWEDFEKQKYLNDVPVKVIERKPVIFTGKKTGTRIVISNLRNKWTRGMVRELHRAVTSICSPFEKEGEFRTELQLKEKSDWLKNLMTVNDVLEFSLFRANCDILHDKLQIEYEFKPLPAMDKVKARKINKTLDFKLDDEDWKIIENFIGPIHLDLYIFDRSPNILALGVTDKKGLKDFLNESGGIRVYRDGMRVYDYGESGNDWLNLSGLRVNIPTRRISNNLVLGAVSLQLDKSSNLKNEKGVGLIEKTNREGFVNNLAYQVFKKAVYYTISQVETERNIDKKRIRDSYSRKRIREPVLEDLSELRNIVERKRLTKDLGPYIDRIEADFLTIRDRFLTSASAGLSLSVVIHEVEKGVAELTNLVKKEKTSVRVKKLAKHISELIEGFASLIRKSGIKLEAASTMIARAVFNTELRLKIHNIKLVVISDKHNFKAKCSRRLIISTIMNLIDNSIWWLDTKWGPSSKNKYIYISTSNDFKDGPAIVIADNGPGFVDPPEYLIEPFISRKPDGMGLGLHIADQVMKAQSGRLAFPEQSDVHLPKRYNGALVALVFGGLQK